MHSTRLDGRSARMGSDGIGSATGIGSEGKRSGVDGRGRARTATRRAPAAHLEARLLVEARPEHVGPVRVSPVQRQQHERHAHPRRHRHHQRRAQPAAGRGDARGDGAGRGEPPRGGAEADGGSDGGTRAGARGRVRTEGTRADGRRGRADGPLRARLPQRVEREGVCELVQQRAASRLRQPKKKKKKKKTQRAREGVDSMCGRARAGAWASAPCGGCCGGQGEAGGAATRRRRRRRRRPSPRGCSNSSNEN
jgi:hypothetical protein